MKTVTLATGEKVPALGLGTWKMGVGDADEAEQLRALQTGIDLGIRLIDTAEMYGEGRSERLVAKAVVGRRDDVFLVSKVLPQNASREGTIAACEASLKRLSTDRLDLYLLHWRGSYPLGDTLAAFETLKSAGKIRHYGVSNFDVKDLDELAALKAQCAANQVEYSLEERGIEWALRPRCEKDRIAVMAYCPLGQGRLVSHPALAQIARKHAVAPAAIAIAFTLRLPGMISIPKSSREERIRDNAKAASLSLDTEDLAALDKAFPPPRKKTPLAMS